MTASTTPTEPVAGRVTARRLNRVEYNNTIRDLARCRSASRRRVPGRRLGLRVRQQRRRAVGVSAPDGKVHAGCAKDISRLAVYGEALPPKPTRLVRLMNRRSQDAYDVVSRRQLRHLPAVFAARRDVRQLTRSPSTASTSSGSASRISAATTADITDEERARRAEERRKLFEARRLEREKAGGRCRAAAPAPGGGRGGGPRREPTPEELKARDEAARKAAPPRKLILTVDGAPVISTVIEGTGSFGYSQGEFTARATVKAGERFIRASYPELADLDSPLQNINPDMRRGLFVDYLDIVGPFNPSTAPPESYKKIFICSQKTTQCARTILSSLMERAYRRPVTERRADVEARPRRARAARGRFVRGGHPPGAAGDSRVAEFPVPHRSESETRASAWV